MSLSSCIHSATIKCVVPAGISFGHHRGFFRFTNITIPQSATVTSAKVTFTCQVDGALTTVNLRCYCNAHDNAVAPTSYAESEALALTDAVNWDAVDAWTAETTYDTPDLTSIVQDVTDRSGWSSGNALMVLVRTATISSGTRAAYDTAGSATKSALLTIVYEPAVQATPFILVSSMSAYSVETPDSLGYAYEESTGGSGMDIAVKTGEGVGKNILQQKQMKYLYYDLNTHGKDVTVTVYIDGVAQTNTITLNTTSRIRGRYEDIPDTWQGYRFSLSISCDDITDDDLEIYAPFAIQYTAFGV